MSDKPTYAQRMLQAQANEMVERGTAQAARLLPILDWPAGQNAVRLVAAEVLGNLLEEAQFYGEETISVWRVKRLREQLNPGSVGGEG